MKKLSLRDLTLIPLFSILIVVCTWISIPMPPIPFTLQTMAIFLAVGVLRTSGGFLAVVVYLLLGLVGLPVFTGFRGGFSVLAGPTGGYLVGFLFTAPIMGLMRTYLPKTKVALVLSMVVGLLVCYGFGTVWFLIMMTGQGSAMTFGAACMVCVVPYLPADAIKILLAFLLIPRISGIYQRFLHA